MQDVRAADGESGDSGKSQSFRPLRSHMQQIAEQGRHGQQCANYVQPDGLPHRCHSSAVTEAELEQHGGESDSGYNDHRKWAEKCASVREKHYYGENSA